MTTYNDFVIRFANVNGSGSASANGMFAKALFRMGIPVATRNIFPSNIQGLPTWFEVRASEKGYLGRREGIDIMVAMNAETYEEDLASIVPGGFLLHDNSQGGDRRLNRSNINDLGIPLSKLVQSEFKDPKQRQLLKNIVYLGALSALLNIDFEIITGMVSAQYKGKDDLIQPNITAMEIGRSYAHDYMDSPLPIQVRASEGVGNRILIDGNAAAALGALYGGAPVCAWYPITPSTSMGEAFEQHASRLRVDPDTNRENYAVIQAEDELAARVAQDLAGRQAELERSYLADHLPPALGAWKFMGPIAIGDPADSNANRVRKARPQIRNTGVKIKAPMAAAIRPMRKEASSIPRSRSP